MTSVDTSRVALVTGATRGIGQAIAQALGAAGHTVIGTATSAEGAQSISAAFSAAGMKGEGRRFQHRGVERCRHR